MKTKSSFIALALTGLLGSSMVSCTQTPYEAYVTLDINPSIGLVMNQQQQVLTAHALNEDGEMVLITLQLSNESLSSALTKVIDQSIALGYISLDVDTTTIAIDAVSKTARIEERVRQMVTTHLDKAMNAWRLNHEIRQRVYTQNEIIAAQLSNVTPAFLRLKEILEPLDVLGDDDVISLNGSELARKLYENRQNVLAIATTLRQQLHTALQEIQEPFQAQIQMLVGQITQAKQQHGNTAMLEATLNAAMVQMRSLLQAAIGEFAQQSQALREQMMIQHATIIAEFEAAIAAYKLENGIS